VGDPRVSKLAKTLVGYSLAVKPGEVVLISTTDAGKPLALAAYGEVLSAGGQPILDVSFEEADELLFRLGSPEQVAYLPKPRTQLARAIDCYLTIRAPLNRKLLSHAPPAEITRRQSALKPWKDIIVDEKRWCVTNFPTAAIAQEAEMPLSAYEDFFYKATSLDWPKVEAQEEELKQRLDASRTVRIVGRETDLTFSVARRKAAKCYGKHNMPDGEVFTAPVEDSTEGHVFYEFPAIYGGREVTGIRLTFKKGLVTEATAEKNQDLLRAMLDMDPGARRLGEFGIGVNYSIKSFTKDILCDEKMGGTVHLALGKGYPETGSKNDSALHWDMIKDLRGEGELYLDGELIQRNGRFRL